MTLRSRQPQLPPVLLGRLSIINSLHKDQQNLTVWTKRIQQYLVCHRRLHLVDVADLSPAESVASLGWVTPGAANEGVTPLFFPEKPGDLFLLITSCHYQYHFLLLLLGCHLPPRGCHPAPFLPVRPRFSTILSKFALNFFLRVSPSAGCHPGRSAPS